MSWQEGRPEEIAEHGNLHWTVPDARTAERKLYMQGFIG